MSSSSTATRSGRASPTSRIIRSSRFERIPTAKTSAALTWVICPMNTPGITVRPIRTMAGAYKFCEVFYDNVRDPLSNVVGGLNNGWRTAMSTLAFERGTASLALLIAADASRSSSCLRLALRTGRIMRVRIAQLRAEGAAVRAMTYRFALDSADSTPDSRVHARLSFAEYSQRVSAAAIDLFGIDAPEVVGMHGMGHDYLDAFSETIAGGTSEIQRNIIAERVLGLPKGPR